MTTSHTTRGPWTARAHLSVADAAWLLQLRPAQVRLLIADGSLACDQTCHGWRITPADLLPLLLSTESRRALRDLVRGDISTPPVPHGARPLPLAAARKERS